MRKVFIKIHRNLIDVGINKKENKMLITGIKKETVKVDVEPKELVLRLAELIGIYPLFEENSDYYAELKEDGGKKYMVTYKNTSYHGSTNYSEKGRKNLTQEEYDAAIGLCQIMKIIKRK